MCMDTLHKGDNDDDDDDDDDDDNNNNNNNINIAPNSFRNDGPFKPYVDLLRWRTGPPRTSTYQTRHRKTRKHQFHELDSNSQPWG